MLNTNILTCDEHTDFFSYDSSQVYLQLFKKFGWTQVALLAEDGQEFPEYHTFLQDLFLINHISVAYHRKIPRQATSEDAVKVIITYQFCVFVFCLNLIIFSSSDSNAFSVIVNPSFSCAI